MQITMTQEQRMGVMSLLARQQPKKMKEQLTQFDVFRKVEVDEATQDKLVVHLPGGAVRINAEEAAKVSVVDFEKAELRAVVELLESSPMGVGDLRWAAPLLESCNFALSCQ